MGKFYNVILDSVTTLDTDKTKIDKVKVNVKNDGTDVTDLVKADFVLANTAGAVLDADWTLDDTDKANGNYEVDFADTKELANNDFLIVQVLKGENDSDRLFIDFAEGFDASGQATYSYEITEAGSYKFIIDKAAGETLNKASTDTYIFNNAPVTAESSIVAQFDKPYLAQVVPAEGLDVSLLVTLEDESGDPLTGNNEVSLYADLQ